MRKGTTVKHLHMIHCTPSSSLVLYPVIFAVEAREKNSYAGWGWGALLSNGLFPVCKMLGRSVLSVIDIFQQYYYIFSTVKSAKNVMVRRC